VVARLPACVGIGNRAPPDLCASYVIGDRWRDINCVRAAGCRAIFIERGYEESLREAPDFTVATFADAVNALLRDARV
jgi:D-glycero-D-manno-heptose 1,7-bisphosphate phosphatase